MRVRWTSLLVSLVLLGACTSSAASPTSPGDSPEPFPSPGPPTPMPSEPVPSAPRNAAMTWHAIGAIGRAMPVEGGSLWSASVRDVVGFDGGYVAIGWPAGDATDDAWYSATGSTWVPVDLPFVAGTSRYGQALDAHPSAVASNGREIMIVGGYFREPCRKPSGDTGAGNECQSAPISWISSDGLTWRRAPAWPASETTPDDNQGDEFMAAWGTASGWQAGAFHWAGEGVTGPVVWASSDGLTWNALPKPPALGIGGAQGPWGGDGIGDASGTALVWQRWRVFDGPVPNDQGGQSRATLASWTARQGWTAIDGFDGTDVEIAGLAAPVRAGSPWVVVGVREPWQPAPGATQNPDGIMIEGGFHYSPFVRVSADLETWADATLGVREGSVVDRVTDVVATTDGYVAVGALFGEAVDQETWLSVDGRTWAQARNTEQLGEDFGPSMLASGPAGVIGVGIATNDGAIGVWALR